MRSFVVFFSLFSLLILGASSFANHGDHNPGKHNARFHFDIGFNADGHNSGKGNAGAHSGGDHNAGYHNGGGHNAGKGNAGDHNGGGHNAGEGNAGDHSGGGLEWDYYSRSCPEVYATVRDIVWRNVSANPGLPAKLLRLQYHDCFVRGCDASILLDSTPGNKSEKESIPNKSLSGFDLIDLIKVTLEEKCPDVVSCADIVALAARDAVSFQFGRPMWPVFTGRQDGRVSISSEAEQELPSPFANFTDLLDNFRNHGLDIFDLVTLSGAHTIGVSRCFFIAKRLYNFTGNGDTDGALDTAYAQELETICPRPVNSSTIVEMDPQSSTSFDSHYFVALNEKKGFFTSDAALLTDPEAARIAQLLEDPHIFFERFASSMVKMSGLGVPTNDQGEIRKNCRVVNPKI